MASPNDCEPRTTTGVSIGHRGEAIGELSFLASLVACIVFSWLWGSWYAIRFDDTMTRSREIGHCLSFGSDARLKGCWNGVIWRAECFSFAPIAYNRQRSFQCNLRRENLFLQVRRGHAIVPFFSPSFLGVTRDTTPTKNIMATKAKVKQIIRNYHHKEYQLNQHIILLPTELNYENRLI